MSRRVTTILTCASTVGVAATLALAPGVADAAVTTGTELTAHDNGNCTVTFTLTNHTNSAYFQPDWWFESEGPAPANGADPSTFQKPWRTVPSTGTNWPFARWIGDPALHSTIADGVDPWSPGVTPYLSGASPEGAVSTATIDPRKADPAGPAPSDSGTFTLKFRINNGPQTSDRVGEKSVEVTGCASKPGSGSSTGSLDFGSVSGLLPH